MEEALLIRTLAVPDLVICIHSDLIYLVALAL